MKSGTKRLRFCVLLMSSWTIFNCVADEVKTLPFDISWPVTDPTVTNTAVRPLLKGALIVRQKNQMLSVSINLTRPDDEVHRAFWNKNLMYREYEWMDHLRVWDRHRKWLYPNLACLLTIHGEDRVGRYGGWDKGHQNDNDFAGLLIRKYDAAGNEASSTKASPLVTAGWEPVASGKCDKFTLVHQAHSEALTIRMDEDQGQAKIWLVYGDFMGTPMPESWPREMEFCGGILAFFHVKWKQIADNEFDISISHQVPEESTGFDWEDWIGRYGPEGSVEAESVLSEALK